jgi:hypothetical protein
MAGGAVFIDAGIIGPAPGGEGKAPHSANWVGINLIFF